MVRAILFVVIVAILLLIAALATGLLRFHSGMGSRTNAVGNAATIAPSRTFDVETGSVHVGSRTAPVKVPKVETRRPADPESNQTANSSDEQR